MTNPSTPDNGTPSVGETPRTDIEVSITHQGVGRISIVGANFARQLERELAQVTSRLFADDSDSIVAACNCLTKSPDIQYHKKGCKYRLITERDALQSKLTDGYEEMGTADVELKKQAATFSPRLRKSGMRRSCRSRSMPGKSSSLLKSSLAEQLLRRF